MHYLLITFCIPLMTLAVVYSQHWVEVCLRLQLGLCCLNIIISFISKYTAEFKGQPHHNPQPAFLYWSQGMQNVLWEYKILQGTPAGQQDVLHENAELIVRVCKSSSEKNPSCDFKGPWQYFKMKPLFWNSPSSFSKFWYHPNVS